MPSCMHGHERKFSILYNFIIYVTPYPVPLIWACAHMAHISMYIYSNGIHTESHNMLRIYICLWNLHDIPYIITSLSAFIGI